MGKEHLPLSVRGQINDRLEKSRADKELISPLDSYRRIYISEFQRILKNFVEYLSEERTKEEIWQHFKENYKEDEYGHALNHYTSIEADYYEARRGRLSGYKFCFMAVGFTEEETKLWKEEMENAARTEIERVRREYRERKDIPPESFHTIILKEIKEHQKFIDKHDSEEPVGSYYYMVVHENEVLREIAGYLQERHTREELYAHFRAEFEEISDKIVMYNVSPYLYGEEYSAEIYGKSSGYQSAFRAIGFSEKDIDTWEKESRERVRPTIEEMVKREKTTQPKKLTKKEFIQAIKDLAAKEEGKNRKSILPYLGYLTSNADSTIKSGGYLFIREDGLPTWSTLDIKEVDPSTGMPFGSNWYTHHLYLYSTGK